MLSVAVLWYQALAEVPVLVTYGKRERGRSEHLTCAVLPSPSVDQESMNHPILCDQHLPPHLALKSRDWSDVYKHPKLES
jgi:hypothetical protein